VNSRWKVRQLSAPELLNCSNLDYRRNPELFEERDELKNTLRSPGKSCTYAEPFKARPGYNGFTYADD
jgi:hypothetical protein